MSRGMLIAIAALVLAGCATRFPVADGLMLRLPGAEVLGADRYATQLVTVRAPDQEHTFQANIELVEGELVLVASDAIGTPLFGMRHERRTSIEMFAPIEGGPPLELVMADLMLVFAPVQELRENLGGGEVQEQGLTRRILNRDGAVVITITYEASDPWIGRTLLEHAERDYSLEIITVESGPL